MSCEHGRSWRCPDCIEEVLGPGCSAEETARRIAVAKKRTAYLDPDYAYLQACSELVERIALAHDRFTHYRGEQCTSWKYAMDELSDEQCESLGEVLLGGEQAAALLAQHGRKT